MARCGSTETGRSQCGAALEIELLSYDIQCLDEDIVALEADQRRLTSMYDSAFDEISMAKSLVRVDLHIECGGYMKSRRTIATQLADKRRERERLALRLNAYERGEQ